MLKEEFLLDLKRGIMSQLHFMVRRKEFKVAITFNLIFNLVSYLYQVYIAIGEDTLEVVSAAYAFSLNSGNPFWSFYQILFPFIVVVPFAFSYFDDKNLNVDYYIETRMGRKSYIISKLITSFLGCFLAVCIPFFINMILNEVTFPHNGISFETNIHSLEYAKSLTGEDVIIDTVHKGIMFLKLYIFSPEVYNLFLLLLFSSVSGILGSFCMCFSYFYKKHKIILFLPVYIYIYIGNILSNISSIFGKYINFYILDYLNLNVNFGRRIYVLLFEILIILMFILLSTIREIKKENL